MPEITYFTRDGRCSFIKGFIKSVIPKYLSADASQDGVEHYAVLEWNGTTARSIEAIREWFEADGIRYVDRLEDLPEGAGVLIMGYDIPPEKERELAAAGIPHRRINCRWVAKDLREELQRVDAAHQCVLMIERGHVVDRNYHSLYPPGTILVDVGDYQEQLGAHKDARPAHLIPYATYRDKDVEAVERHIASTYPHPDNIFFRDSMCSWSTTQGLFDEIREKVRGRALTEVWIVCNHPRNVSVKSLQREIVENGAIAKLISTPAEIPEDARPDARIGVVVAPVPYPRETEILAAIRARWGGAA